MKGIIFVEKIEKALKVKRDDIIKVEFSRYFNNNVYFNIGFRHKDKNKIYEIMWLNTSSFSKNIKLINDELDDIIEFIEGRCIL